MPDKIHINIPVPDGKYSPDHLFSFKIYKNKNSSHRGVKGEL